MHLTQEVGYSFRTLNPQVCVPEKWKSKNEEEKEKGGAENKTHEILFCAVSMSELIRRT
jgi:hypothetical protein